ncbi:MAG: bifunctional phosphopantothenoylcysteine decarboxylase/phosphopantothenate--cysteine ligase CoaBC [Lachnospiraceae bacterium]|nr:bifunctional phosphopantothenoylcysteine decarboxylase/phosphopantothenate--cysteine ligase CoaBC [Lachnospiraceae bacterium]
MLKGKTVLLGVTGSIAAYKIANLASMLVKQHADVHVIMTKNACEFITPMTFETLTNNKCVVDTFDRNFQFNVEHVSLAKMADLCLIAPASANIIGKIANGIADDMLSTTVMALKCPCLISPAMNTRMFENRIVQDNLEKLKGYGYKIIEPDSGYLACGDTGAGKLPPVELLYEHIYHEIAFDKILEGKNVLVTAGPTVEAIDPVRFITNHSTGKMGIQIARVAAACGASVTLCLGPVNEPRPVFANIIDIKSAEDMYEAVTGEFDKTDIVVKAAAVADYTPESVADEKIKKDASDEKSSIPLKRTKDILKYLGENKKEGQFICGFSMETENMLENSKKKLEKKNLDMIIANNLKVAGAGFGVDTNVITMIKRDKEQVLVKEYPLLSKEEVALEILKNCVNS